ncbi:snare-like protein [Hanseniaspora valbyensis NRRL Y-1626]|uniref:Coatomer subunit zeta n=1 Tax=Hanseniaspora valbyensis NRRL Y-1626 TaxID=766949 RepID=A0A1B7TB60_9ASCO|nr:snare-like protein [Hanseniaspora valbyensis NRRL Y-1626]
MVSPLSLYTISSFLILNEKGKRVFNKYYTNPFVKYEEYEKSKEDPQYTSTKYLDLDISLSKKKQIEFEKLIFKKINEAYGSNSNTTKDIELLVNDNKVSIFQRINDLTFVLTSTSPSEDVNEILLQLSFEGIIKSLDLLLDGGIDLQSLNNNFDLLSLVVDESIDDGVVLQYDENAIINRITLMTEDEGQINLNNIAEKGLKSAWGFAKTRFAL